VEVFDVVGSHGDRGHGVPVRRHRVDLTVADEGGVGWSASYWAVGGVGSDPAIGSNRVIGVAGIGGHATLMKESLSEMTFRALPLQSRLQELFDYNPDTGILMNRRLNRPAGYNLKGGKSTKTHRVVKVDGHVFTMHRLIWMWWYGEDPGAYLVDHIDQNSLNNRLDNLRLATRELNRRNSKLNRNRISCPYRNVYRNGRKWMARVTIQGKLKSLGTFETPEEARDAVTRHDKSFDPDDRA